MSIDPSVLKRLLNVKITVEGPSGWAFREILDYIVEIIEERLSLVLNESLEPYGLEASIHLGEGCEFFPNERQCNDIIVVKVYDRETNEQLAYAGYLRARGENTFIFELLKVIDAETKQAI